MMRNILLLILAFPLLAATPSVQYQHFDGLKIGDKTYPVGSTLVEMKSTSQGLLIPRMTTTQRLAIASPVDGLLVYDTNLKTVVEYNSTLSAWTFLVASGGGAVLNPSVAVQTDSSGNLTSSSITATQLQYLNQLVAAGGDVVIMNSSGLLGLSNGSSGQILTSNGTTLSPTWNTNFLGNAATATTATTATSATSATNSTNATNIAMAQSAANAIYYPLLSTTSTNGNVSPVIATGFNINPSTDTVTATTFSGALSGNASTSTTATNATNIATTKQTASATYFLDMFASSGGGNQGANFGTGLTFNPSSDVLTTTTFSGALSGNSTTSTTATNATNVATTSTTTNASFYPLMVSSSSNSNQAASLMTGFTFNPGTDVMVAGSYVTAYATTTTAAGTTTLTSSSPGQQFFTGATTQTVKLPVTSTLQLGQQFFIVNNSSGTVTVQSSGSNTIQAMTGSTFATFTCILLSGTSAASWAVEYTATGTPTFSGLTQWGSIYASSTTTVASTAAATAGGDVLTSVSSAAPIWQVPVTGNYWSGYHANGMTWSTTSATFADPTSTGTTPAITKRFGNGITVTQGGSSVPGITFTPALSTSIYEICAMTTCATGLTADAESFQLVDTSSVVISTLSLRNSGSPSVTLCGLYAPATASAVTVKIQLASSSVNGQVIGAVGTLAQSIEWTLIQIK